MAGCLSDILKGILTISGIDKRHRVGVGIQNEGIASFLAHLEYGIGELVPQLG